MHQLRASAWTLSIAAVLSFVITACATRMCPACGATAPSSAYEAYIVHENELAPTLFQTFTARSGTAKNALILSGGGANGAWGAGVLNGWTDRPEFDIVTGISTGALIATYAYLGKIKDADLMKAYTTVSDKDIFRERFLLTVPFSSSLRTTEPLETLLKRYAGDDVIQEVGKIYENERRLLFIGTVNYDSGGFVIWNLGKLAASSNPSKYEMYRKLLLAATAIPVLFPPVVLDGAMHVDGGVREQVFGATFAAAASEAHRAYLKSVSTSGATGRTFETPTAYVIINGQLPVRRKCVKPEVLEIAFRAVTVLLSEGMIGNLYRLGAEMKDWMLKLSRIDDTYLLESESDRFDQKKMQRLFDAGREAGMKQSWENVPPPLTLSPLPCVD